MEIKTWKKVWLIILVLVVIGSQVEDVQSAEPNATAGERTISFPTDISMGKLSVRDLGSTEPEDWTDLGEARGDVTVPAGKELQLIVGPKYSGDISPLADLGPTDLQELHMKEVQVGDAGLAHLKGLTSLRLLNLSGKQVRVTAKPHPLLGKPLGELKFTSTKGEQIDISQYKGKVVLVDFWAVWCRPCINELPNVLDTYSKYHDDGFEIIGISLDSSREKLEKFIKENNMPWPQYFDGKGWKNEISTGFGIHSIPSTFLLDGQGIVRHVNLRGSALKNAVEDLLRGPWKPDAQITDTGMAHLKGLTSLETLRLDNTQVGDEGLTHIAGLPSLKTLFLAGTQITDAGLAHLGDLTTLHKLCVGRTQVSDAGLEHLKGLTALERLNLRGTSVSNAGLMDLKESLPNCVISGSSAPERRRAPKSRLARGLERLPDAGIPLYLFILIIAIVTPIVCLLLAVFIRTVK